MNITNFEDCQPQLAPTRVVWRTSVPKEIRATVEPLLAEVMWLLPRWCEELIVAYEVDNRPGYSAAMLNSEEYRWCKLYLYPGWLELQDELRRFDLVHEFIHGSNGYLSDFIKVSFGKLIKDETLRELMRLEWQKYLERATQDLSMCIYTKLYGKLPAIAEREHDPKQLSVESSLN